MNKLVSVKRRPESVDVVYNAEHNNEVVEHSLSIKYDCIASYMVNMQMTVECLDDIINICNGFKQSNE